MPNNHRITIGLYSIQSGTNFNGATLDQVTSIFKIKERFSQAAQQRGDLPPELVISVLLIPDWKSGSHFFHDEYLEAYHHFFTQLSEQFPRDQFHLENFYDIAGDAEKGYLEQLESRKSNADMIKTGALIAEVNRTKRHLQLDSNTIIHDYQGLYNATFGRPDSAGVNVGYYADDYVSIHNNIVYAPPGTHFIEQLRAVHLDYCRTHKDDHKNESTQKEKVSTNSIYAQDFTVAAHKAGLTTVISIPLASGEMRTIYPAVLRRPEYGLSQFIVTPVNISWKQDPLLFGGILAKLPSVQVGDAVCDLTCFRMVMQKLTGSLHSHKYGGNPELLAHDLEITDLKTVQAVLFDDTEAYQEFLACSNTQVDKIIIVAFYEHARVFFSSDRDFLGAMKLLAKEFPSNLRGNALTKELFGCTVRELQDTPIRHILHASAIKLSETEDEKSLLTQSMRAQLVAIKKASSEQHDEKSELINSSDSDESLITGLKP